ncbi:MAG: hypothetical protein GTO62_04870 [Planctomycetales bacterium]|nr:hypothetical protein [Planctomycetales bacterium]NIP68590.1 hypothetical protein [Planctomycetales bacterium]
MASGDRVVEVMVHTPNLSDLSKKLIFSKRPDTSGHFQQIFFAEFHRPIGARPGDGGTKNGPVGWSMWCTSVRPGTVGQAHGDAKS